MASRETLDAALQPFQAAVDSGVELVMVASASYPAYGPENRPASAVQAITDTLRGQLGFKGVVITDNLQSIAIETLTTPAAAGVAALGAGCDLLLYSSAGGSRTPSLPWSRRSSRRSSAANRCRTLTTASPPSRACWQPLPAE